MFTMAPNAIATIAAQAGTMIQAYGASSATAGSDPGPSSAQARLPAAAPMDMPTYSAEALIASSRLRRSGARPIRRFCCGA